MNDWIPEQIPDQDCIFMRVHQGYVKDGDLIPGVFRDHGRGMSTDWEGHANPFETRARAKKPEENGVISLVVGAVRQEVRLLVEHAPDEATRNRAHTEVVGEKTPRVRVLLHRMFRWEIALPGIA
jgi:hypothetical protein